MIRAEGVNGMMTVELLTQALTPQLNADDRRVSVETLRLLARELDGPKRDLVFFVGAGASAAGNTGMPVAPEVLRQLMLAAAQRLDQSQVGDAGQAIRDAIDTAAWSVGFEKTLDRLRAIEPACLPELYQAWAVHEAGCHANHVHRFLAHWLETGGCVVTTNYDRLIERCFRDGEMQTKVRYSETGHRSFADWPHLLAAGGGLFKLHGSLEDPSSCLGALENVRTRLVGYRAECLATICATRPLCVVGWRGVDPDIPPVFAESLAGRVPTLPIVWVHFHGRPPGSSSLAQSISGVPTLLREVAAAHPVCCDAEQLFAPFFQEALGTQQSARQEPAPLTLADGVRSLSSSQAARFLGGAFRQSQRYGAANLVLSVSDRAAATSSEHRLALLARAHALWAQGGNGDRALEPVRPSQFVHRLQHSLRKYNRQAAALGLVRQAQCLGANDSGTAFGELSMTFSLSKTNPTLLLKLPTVFKRYRQSIANDIALGYEDDHVALHEAVLALYHGLFRERLLGPLARCSSILAEWMLAPFDQARRRVRDAPDNEVHHRINVLLFHALAYARVHRCDEAWADVREIQRLLQVWSDSGLTRYVEKRLSRLRQRCPEL